MSRIFRRVFLLNFLILLVALLSYSQLTNSFFEKDFFYLAIILILSSIIISYLVSKIIILPIVLNLKNSKEEFEKFNNDMKNQSHQKSFELELVNSALQEKAKEQKELAETLQEKLTFEIINREKKEQLLIHQSRLAGIGKISINMLNECEESISSVNFILQNINTIHKQIDFKNELVNKSMEQLHRVINEMQMKNEELKNFIKPNEEKKEFHLDEIVMKSLEMLEETFMNHHIKIDYNFSKSITLYGFPTEFSQVIFNILQNAKDALIEKDVLVKKVFISIKKDNDFASVTIVDNAGGIAQNIIENIFEPYFTTKSYRKASGLGLFISKIIIEENMQGKLDFENASEGAKFTIKIPFFEENK
jgi:two-component system, NtrC family, C4-dicarboxylate transport sensor histidine kinase DctB